MSLLKSLFGQGPSANAPSNAAMPEAPRSGYDGAPVDAKTALDWIKRGAAPEGLVVSAPLRIPTKGGRAPASLSAPIIDMTDAESLPAGLRARRISVHGERLVEIGAGLKCEILSLRRAGIQSLPADVSASVRIDLEECRRLVELPEHLTTGTLNLTNCTALERLPAGLSVAFLDLAGCTALRSLPDDLRLRGGRLNLRDCALLTELPPALGSVAQLDISGCLNLRRLPEGLEVTSWIDVGGSGVQQLPEGFDHVGVRWRGVPVPRHVVFAPASMTHDEILVERNAEVRRVMIERFGYERFMREANAQEEDRDMDAGGERRLLRIAIPGDEDLVCVSVKCPSTGHQFLLRVPPHMRTCRQAVAWTAGFDDPDLYRPSVET